MTAANEKRSSSFAKPAAVISLAIVAGLGVLVWRLQVRATGAQARLDAAIQQYESMKTMRSRVQDLLRRAPAGAQEQVDPSKIATFLSAAASRAGLQAPKIQQTTPPKSGGWSETAMTLTLGGARDTSIARGPFIDFLAAVERERPYLKSKDLSMNFARDGSDLTSARAVISHFRRE